MGGVTCVSTCHSPCMSVCGYVVAMCPGLGNSQGECCLCVVLLIPKSERDCECPGCTPEVVVSVLCASVCRVWLCVKWCGSAFTHGPSFGRLALPVGLPELCCVLSFVMPCGCIGI